MANLDNINKELIDKVINIAKNAGDEILNVYKTSFSVKLKENNSPLTSADLVANELITNQLKKISDYPILSEEGEKISYNIRKGWEFYWLIDPLDGTKEFVKKNGDFTVNIALIKNNHPVFGVVFAPVFNRLFWGAEKFGSWEINSSGEIKKISVSKKYNDIFKIVTSRSHPSSQLNSFISQFSKIKLIQRGSSLKICLIANGEAQIYPRLGPTMEWDTAAADAILRNAGGCLRIYGTNNILKYNKEELLNSKFIAIGNYIENYYKDLKL